MSHPIGQTLREKGHKLLDCGDYWRMAAVFRGGRSPTSIAIKKKTGEFKDFGMSSPWRKAEELVKLLNGDKVDFSNYVPEVEAVDKIETQKTYPKEILKRLLPKYGIFPTRGISLATLKLFEAGYAMGNKMGNRVCFPIYDEHGRIIGFSGRWLQETPPDQVPKWKHVAAKNSFLWPLHLTRAHIVEAQAVLIIESIGDGLALWEAGIRNFLCIFGTSISSKQISCLLGLDPKLIVIATNNDSTKVQNAGKQGAIKIAAKLKKHFGDSAIQINLPPEKDFGQMDKSSVKDWYEKTIQNKPKSISSDWNL